MAERPSTALTTISQKKQSRASKPKVRTGCQTCKRRKVKCDETKPHCTRCARADLECEGYGIFIDVRSRHGFTILHTAPTAQKVPLLSDTFIFYRGLNALSELSELENASYDFARQCTVSDLSSLQCVHFWSSSVMSGCHSDPAILHAVLALGAAHRSHVLARSTIGPSSADSFSSVAYTHYGKAIKHLQTRVSLDGAENYRIVLIACIVLLSFDLLQGRYGPALVHLHHGRRILKLQYGLKANTTSSNLLYLPPQTRTVDDELVYSFGQIDLQATNFGGGKPQFAFVDHPDKLDPNEQVIPDAFTSVEDAGRYVMILMNDCWRLIGLLPDNTKLNYANAEAVNHRFRLLASCERWEQAFHKGNFPHPSTESARDPDARKAVILQMHHALITIKVSVCLSYPDEMVFDSLLPYYSNIISLAGRLFPNLPTFNLDTAIIHPVYSAAIHCRHPVIRRKAVEILRQSGREGLWDSRMTVLVAEEVIQHEERHAGYFYNDQASLPADLQLADIIPRESRIAQSWMFFADETQKVLRTVHKRPKWSRGQGYSANAPNVNEDEDVWEVIEKLTPFGDE